MLKTTKGLAFAGAMLLVGCAQEQPQEKKAAPVKLTIMGSSTMAPLVIELAKVFQERNPGVAIDVKSGGSGVGISAAREGKADIGMASRALSDKERDLQGFAIARDGVSVVVHRDNPVQALNSAQVVGIFTGRIRNWKALGGGDAPITVINRAEGFSSLEVFTQYFEVNRADIKATITAAENDATYRALAADRNAITYVSVGESERRAAAGEPIKTLAIDGVAATSANVRAGKYGVVRSLTLITKGLPAGAAKNFIDYALSPQAAPIIRRHDFVTFAD